MSLQKIEKKIENLLKEEEQSKVKGGTTSNIIIEDFTIA